MIDRNEDVKCPWCGAIHKLGVWNDLAYSKCVNREMKRAFTNLMEEKAFLRKSDTYYVCPSCNKWSRGSQLSIVNTNNPRLLKLGGELVISNNMN